MGDPLIDGLMLQTFNVLDDYNREGLGIEDDQSLPSAREERVLEQIIKLRGKPAVVRCDNELPAVAMELVVTTDLCRYREPR